MRQQRIRALQELGEQFERLAGQDGRARVSRLRSGLRAAPIVASVLVAVAVAAGALLLVGHGGGGGPGQPSPVGGSPLAGVTRSEIRQLRGYLQRAARQVAHSPACAATHVSRQPALLAGAPSGALLSELAVLRRPATTADRPPPGLLSGMGGVYGSYVRRALVRYGFSYWIAPERSQPYGYTRACATLERAALARELPQIPARLRATALALNARVLKFDMIISGPVDLVCLEFQGATSGGGSCGTPAALIAAEGSGLEAVGATLAGIVPDGVASVTLRFPAGGGSPAASLTSPVVGNVFAIAVPGAAGGRRPSTILWRSSAGRVIKRIAKLPAGAGPARSAFCRQNPGACGAGTSAASSSSSASVSATMTASG